MASPPITFGQLQQAAAEILIAPSLLTPEEQRLVRELKTKVDAQQPVQPFHAQQVLGMLQRMRNQLPDIVRDLAVPENEKLMAPAEFQLMTTLHKKMQARQGVTVAESREALRIFQYVRVLVQQALSRLKELEENMGAILGGADQDILVAIGTKIDFGNPITASDAHEINRIYRSFRENFGGYEF